MIQPASAPSTDTDFIMLEYQSITNPSGNFYSINTITVLQNSLTNAISDGEEIKLQFVIYGTIGATGATGPPAPAAGTEIVATDNLLSLSLTSPSLSGATDNILLGRDAGSSLTTGSENIKIGKNAGRSAKINNNNICIGVNAKSLHGGFPADNENIAIGGDSALYHAGKNCVFVGGLSGSGTNNYTADDIVCIGYGSANNISGVNTKDRLTTLGAYTGNSNPGTSSLYLGYKAAENGNSHINTIVLNDSGSAFNPTQASSFFVRPIRNNTGVANALFYDSTTGEITYDTAAGTEIVATQNLRSLTTNTGTNLTSAAENNILLGENVGQGLTTQDNNIQIGHNINEFNEGVRNILIGRDIGRTTTGGYNIALGSNIGNNISQGISADRNIMIGHNVGGGRIVGQYNVLIGESCNAGSNGVSLINNTFIGRESGRNCRSSENTFIGRNAGLNNVNGSNNTSIGHNSAPNNNSSHTINIGVAAGWSRPTGEDHAICIGAQTGNFGSGQYSVQLGYRANYNTPANYKRVIVINATGVALESTLSDTCKIAPIRTVAHNLGIGIPFYDTTTKELTVSSTDIAKAHAYYSTSPTDKTTGTFIIFNSTTHNTNSFYDNGTGRFIAPNGGLYTFQLHHQLSSFDAAVFYWRVNDYIIQRDEIYNAYGGSYRTFQSTFTHILGTGDFVELELVSTTGTVRFEKEHYDGVRGYFVGL